MKPKGTVPCQKLRQNVEHIQKPTIWRLFCLQKPRIFNMFPSFKVDLIHGTLSKNATFWACWAASHVNRTGKVVRMDIKIGYKKKLRVYLMVWRTLYVLRHLVCFITSTESTNTFFKQVGQAPIISLMYITYIELYDIIWYYIHLESSIIII